LSICLSANILIQTVLNIISVKNKIKTYLFFAVLIIDVIVLNVFFIKDRTFTENIFALLFALVFVFVKYLIAKYYYKLLKKNRNFAPKLLQK